MDDQPVKIAGKQDIAASPEHEALLVTKYGVLSKLLQPSLIGYFGEVTGMNVNAKRVQADERSAFEQGDHDFHFKEKKIPSIRKSGVVISVADNRVVTSTISSEIRHYERG
jgi:hypothetical protein